MPLASTVWTGNRWSPRHRTRIKKEEEGRGTSRRIGGRSLWGEGREGRKEMPHFGEPRPPPTDARKKKHKEKPSTIVLTLATQGKREEKEDDVTFLTTPTVDKRVAFLLCHAERRGRRTGRRPSFWSRAVFFL